MSKIHGWQVLRTATENAFEGLFFAATALFILGSTVAMCL